MAVKTPSLIVVIEDQGKASDEDLARTLVLVGHVLAGMLHDAGVKLGTPGILLGGLPEEVVNRVLGKPPKEAP